MNGVNSFHNKNTLSKKSSCFNSFEEKIEMEIQLLESLFNHTEVYKIKTTKKQKITIIEKSFDSNKETF